jgi:hypothetical protein
VVYIQPYFAQSFSFTALKDENGVLRGFGGVVRDFSGCHERDERLRRRSARLRPPPSESTVACIISGEFERIPAANDAFLELAGYSREDLQAGVLRKRKPSGAARRRRSALASLCLDFTRRLHCSDLSLLRPATTARRALIALLG